MRIIFLLVWSLALFAQTQTIHLPGEDWVPLFNGKDLTGWIRIGNEKWDIENGTIHGQGITRAYGYLRTEKNYRDFHLSLKFKCEGDGNSGVFFHAEFKPGTADVIQGPQFDASFYSVEPTGTTGPFRISASRFCPRPGRDLARRVALPAREG